LREPHLVGHGTRLLVVLHGHGDRPDSLLDRRTALDPSGQFTIAALAGPIELGDGLHAWFADGDPADTRRLLAAVEHGLEFASAVSGLDRSRAALFGYSQGAAAALAFATRADAPPLGGVATVAGWVPSLDDLDWDPRPDLAALLVHGEDDEVVDRMLGRSAARQLERAGVTASWREHPGAGHALTDAMLADVAAWLEQLP